MTVADSIRSKARFGLGDFLAALVGGIILFFVGIGIISQGYQLIFSDRIFPGVWVAGLDMSSLTPAQASAALEQKLAFLNNGQITLIDNSTRWVTTPGELGMTIDLPETINNAMDIGRGSNILLNLADQLNAWQDGMMLSPVIKLDERVVQNYLQNVASQIDQPVKEAELSLDGLSVVYTPGQPGRILNVQSTLDKLVAQLESFQTGEINLDVEEKKPSILDASVQADFLREAVSAPLNLYLPDSQPEDPGPWTLEPELLAGLFSIDRVEADQGWEYKISINSQAIDQFLDQISSQVNNQPENARFWFDDNTRQLVLYQTGQIGRSLNIQLTRDAIIDNLQQGMHEVSLVLDVTQPDVTDQATAESLGINKLVSSYTSYFRGSVPARLTNIELASEKFYGILIPPNTTFSMASILGDISLENGYAESLIIFNGRSIAGVGGGVCQVSTTLFRTAYYGGYPIVERHEHAYRVYYYEQTAHGTDANLAGLDATVYFPLVDLKFTNDRPYWLLMETYFYKSTMSLTWKFYSGDDGRTVNVQSLGLRNIVSAPAPKYEENPDMPPDTCKQVDWAADGADITVVRTVYNSGQQLSLLGDTIRTHYEPWQAVYQYGSGTQDPEAVCGQ